MPSIYCVFTRKWKKLEIVCHLLRLITFHWLKKCEKQWKWLTKSDFIVVIIWLNAYFTAIGRYSKAITHQCYQFVRPLWMGHKIAPVCVRRGNTEQKSIYHLCVFGVGYSFLFWFCESQTSGQCMCCRLEEYWN